MLDEDDETPRVFQTQAQTHKHRARFPPQNAENVVRLPFVHRCRIQSNRYDENADLCRREVEVGLSGQGRLETSIPSIAMQPISL
jgi:hypothetical protein